MISTDSVSQASSCSRVRAVAPAKVIYNKFFKDKGFFPPVKSANHNTEEKMQQDKPLAVTPSAHSSVIMTL